MEKARKKYHAFISYRRLYGWPLGLYLKMNLKTDGYRVFYDVESMRSGKFNEQIYQSIDDSSTVIVVLPPHALDRCVNPDDWVRREIAYAIRQGKTLIPVFMHGFEPPETLPDDIRELLDYQGVTADENAHAEYWYDQLKTYINQELDPSDIPEGSHTAVSIHQAELTDRLIHACENNENRTVLAVLDTIEQEGFLDEDVMDLAVTHFAEISDYDTAAGLVRRMLDTFPESEEAHICAVNALMNRMTGHATGLLRESIDWLMAHPPYDWMLCLFDIRCDLLEGREDLACQKLAEYRERLKDEPGFLLHASRVFQAYAAGFCRNTASGSILFEGKEDYRQWKKYMNTAAELSPDPDRKEELEKTVAAVSRPGFVAENTYALVLLALASLFVPFPWKWICIGLFVFIVCFSILPAEAKIEYQSRDHAAGFRYAVQILSSVIALPLKILELFFESRG